MHELADALSGAVTREPVELEREFERLLVQCSGLAFRVAYGVLRQREDAEDVAQDALIKAHRNFHQLRQPDSFRAWLVRTTWRLALDRQRANRRRIRTETEHVRARDAVGEHPVIPADVWRAIDALPDKLRLAMILAGIHGHDIRAVARLLRVPEGTVKSRLFHARERMREALK